MSRGVGQKKFRGKATNPTDKKQNRKPQTRVCAIFCNNRKQTEVLNTNNRIPAREGHGEEAAGTSLVFTVDC